jgi:hypothetical protein
MAPSLSRPGTRRRTYAIRIPTGVEASAITKGSSDWSDLTGECDTKDPDGYQHKCCDASSGAPWEEPCPTIKGLASIIGLSIWAEQGAEGVLGDFALALKSISIEI